MLHYLHNVHLPMERAVERGYSTLPTGSEKELRITYHTANLTFPYSPSLSATINVESQSQS